MKTEEDNRVKYLPFLIKDAKKTGLLAEFPDGFDHMMYTVAAMLAGIWYWTIYPIPSWIVPAVGLGMVLIFVGIEFKQEYDLVRAWKQTEKYDDWYKPWKWFGEDRYQQRWQDILLPVFAAVVITAIFRGVTL